MSGLTSRNIREVHSVADFNSHMRKCCKPVQEQADDLKDVAFLDLEQIKLSKSKELM